MCHNGRDVEIDVVPLTEREMAYSSRPDAPAVQAVLLDELHRKESSGRDNFDQMDCPVEFVESTTAMRGKTRAES